MSQYLSYGGFEWCENNDITEEWILSLFDDSKIGYISEVNLDYQKHLLLLHNNYPFAPETVNVEEQMLSLCARSLFNNRNFVGIPKLIPNLNNKENYVVHYRHLKFYLELGLKITAVHKSLIIHPPQNK